ncbi:MAG: T9SS type A sorting domain-containing protein, partial [Hymenobacteraceae bacterium]|nr:T9SS type A sorting domain-containing protein [Hymenobacteraceae bacterium]MDX5397950.1 T9SS type A sorting domain-containing protein [Hymenobacteraceae bacterium]MDX5514022.1 T9SS type A sorting domain-containing protein [Hymenobacteraceae bacterium]
ETGEVNASSVKLLGQPKAPEPGQNGLKDTYPINPGEVARFVAKFDREGLYVWHCHILSHEDHEMMRPYRVVSSDATRLDLVSVSVQNNGNFKLFPNPFTTATTLQYKTETPGNVTVRIFDMQGKLVKEVFNKAVAAGEHQLEIDGSSYSAGMYICEVNLNNQLYRDRIVINK